MSLPIIKGSILLKISSISLNPVGSRLILILGEECMSKFIIIILSVAFITGLTPQAFADDVDYFYSKHFVNDVVYGTVAGLIIGLAVGQGSISTFKMTSLGMYGGIILGLTTSGSSNKPTYEQNPSSDNSPKAPTYVFTFHY
jgi:hypothetical protein